MKKSTIALTTAVILGGLITAGAWFTGKEAEKQYQLFMQQAQQQLEQMNDPELHISIKQSTFERGIFRSDIHYQLDINGVLLEGNDQFFHGPFPINRIMSGHFMPAMFSMENHLSSDDVRLKNIFGQSSFFDSQLSMSYGQTLSGKMNLKPMKYAGLFETSALRFDGTLLGSGEHQWQLPSLKFYAHSNQTKTVEYKDIALRYENKRDEKYPYLVGLGDYELNIAEAVYADSLTMEASHLRSKGRIQIENGRLVISNKHTNDLAISALNQEKQDIGKVKEEMELDLDAQVVNDLIPQWMNSDESQLQATLMALVGNAPKLKLSSTLTNEQKADLLNIAASIRLKPFTLSKLRDIPDFLNIFEPSTLNVTTEISALQKLVAQVTQLSTGTSTADSERFAQTFVDHLRSRASQSGFVALDDKNATIDVKIDQGQLTLNRQPYSTQELVFLFTLLMFSGIGH